MTVRSVRDGDAEAWLDMRCALWPDGSREEHAGVIAAFLRGDAREPQGVLVAENETGLLVGFAELSIRAYAENCSTDNVAYLEGWYVAADARRQGVGRALIAAAEDWGRAQGCTEFASDALPDNEVSIAAHLAAGFEDAGLVRCFRKDL